ncbi:MAG: insulinase family protein [Chitinophagales bacterium]
MIEYSKEILENGLTILHHYDATTPFVVVNTLYKVGAKDEQETKTGFAHLFEHLMFSGSKHFKDFDKPLQEAGGENNAFTNNDYTNYYDIVPAINIEIPLALEADRMQHLNINKKVWKCNAK